MGSKRPHIWSRSGDIGILSLGAGAGNYLEDPEFIPVHQATLYFNEPDLKGIIIRGTGRHFSAGADLNNLRKLATDHEKLAGRVNAGKKLIRLIEGLHLPVVAAIRGICFGGGLEIALASHFRICGDNALFAFPETGHGILPGLGGTVTLPKLVGPGMAARIILSGNILDAGQALGAGLVDFVVPKKELDEFALNFLHRLTDDRDPGVIRSVMASIRNGLHMPFEEALAEETKLFCALAVKNLK